MATETQWHFTTRRVCGADGVSYDAARAARAARADVAHAGQCSRCSSVEDVDAMHARSASLTTRASLNAVLGSKVASLDDVLVAAESSLLGQRVLHAEEPLPPVPGDNS